MNPVFVSSAIRYGPAAGAAVLTAIGKCMLDRPVETPTWLDTARSRLSELVDLGTRDVRLTAGIAVGAVAVVAATRYYMNGWVKRVILKPICQESLLPNSIETEFREPDCQMTLAYEGRGGTLEAVGAGLRVQIGPYACLMTAMHNLAYEKPLWLIKSGKQVCVGKVDYRPLAADAAIVVLAEKTFSVLGVKVASLSPILQGRQVITIVGIAGKGTTGQLHVADAAFHGLGHVEYKATTRGGYSGAAYMSGNNVYGMHTHGGARNGGYDSLYLYSLAKIALSYEEEESDEAFLRRLFDSDDWNKHSIEERGDKVIVRDYSGHYHVVDKKKYHAIEADFDYYDDAVKDEYYRDYQPESAPNTVEPALNCLCPGHRSRASPLAPCCQDKQQQMSGSSSTNELELQSAWRLVRRAMRSKRRTMGPKTSSNPSSAPLPNGGPSTSRQASEPTPPVPMKRRTLA